MTFSLVQEFCKKLGVDHEILRDITGLSPGEVIQLPLNDAHTVLLLERADHAWLMMLVFHHYHHCDSLAMMSLLSLAHYRQGWFCPLLTGLTPEGGHPILLVRIVDHFDACCADFEAAMDLLLQAKARWEKGEGLLR